LSPSLEAVESLSINCEKITQNEVKTEEHIGIKKENQKNEIPFIKNLNGNKMDILNKEKEAQERIHVTDDVKVEKIDNVDILGKIATDIPERENNSISIAETNPKKGEKKMKEKKKKKSKFWKKNLIRTSLRNRHVIFPKRKIRKVLLSQLQKRVKKKERKKEEKNRNFGQKNRQGFFGTIA